MSKDDYYGNLSPMAIVWLGEQSSDNTRNSYRRAVLSLMEFTAKELELVTADDIAAWVEKMTQEGAAPSSINQRVAAVRSYYEFANADHPERENPTRLLKSARLGADLYSQAMYLTVDQTRALLGAIDRSTMRGRRDYALILFLLATGRLISEARLLKVSDIIANGNEITYQWKEGNSRADLPSEAWQAIQTWLEDCQGCDYVFMAIDDADPGASDQPLSSTSINRIIKRCARGAGLSSRLNARILRHTAAMLRKQVGTSPLAIKLLLNHSSQQVTDRYLRQMEGKEGLEWSKVAGLLGLG